MRIRVPMLFVLAVVVAACGGEATLPTTTAPPTTTTTTAPPTTTTTTAPSITVGSEDPGLVWAQVPHDEAVFGGPGDQRMDSVVAGGPGLVAVGPDASGGDWDAAVWVSPASD